MFFHRGEVLEVVVDSARDRLVNVERDSHGVDSHVS